MIPIALVVAVLLQQPLAQRPARSAAARDSATNEARQAIMDVGLKVAEMRTAHDAFRRAVFNFPAAVTVQRAQEMRRSCEDLTAIARAAPGRICRTCFEAGVQRAMNGYRTNLPRVAQVGTRCAGQMTRILAATDPAAQARRDVYAVTDQVVRGLVPYEARLHEVRRALGLVPPPSAIPRR
jgi:hypothetical protein